ncbi:MAG: hypothetical protein HZA12_07095 [Nitrospirae bacterium]|nr:hypothetical protein [Nitrospirota bacterium]
MVIVHRRDAKTQRKLSFLLRLLQKYKNVVIPAWFKREYSVLLQKIISPIEDFGDDIDFCKSLCYLINFHTQRLCVSAVS